MSYQKSIKKINSKLVLFFLLDNDIISRKVNYPQGAPQISTATIWPIDLCDVRWIPPTYFYFRFNKLFVKKQFCVK